MSRRTRKLTKFDRWESLRGRFLAACALGFCLIAALLIVAENDQDNWESLPLSLAFAVAGALALSAAMLVAGMALRWQTLPRRLTTALAAALLTTGVAGAAFCILATANGPRNPLGIAELQHPAVYLPCLAAAVFGAANWPSRPRN